MAHDRTCYGSTDATLLGNRNRYLRRCQRKLLLHDYEIRKLEAQIKEKGYTLVPLQVYFKGSLVKVEIGLARGKKLYDKRQDIAKKDQRREAERDFKVKNLY